ncbi:hypothetical protein [Calothrix sp. 336/3]|uniref:hypothetical protein n=1 Tax=Calothrix sp. 336/3 TaxID=1337936 RepID=UPI0004E3851B|nr:hypothetical protein [Calothrix sp. 336/3]AKG23550.1 hypothetical protein IJ00_21720 [Calothrix sp. 336/3]
MQFAKSLTNIPKTLGLSLLALGTSLSFTAVANAGEINLPNTNSTLLARSYPCPENSGGSVFQASETRNFYVYICGGDLPNTYVGVAKNRNTGGIVLPIRSYNNSRFVAVNRNVRYTLTRSELIVTQNGKVIVRERILRQL